MYNGRKGAGPWDDSAAPATTSKRRWLWKPSASSTPSTNSPVNTGVHPNLIREWKKHLLSELPQIFNSRKGDEQKTLVEERERLFQQIGQLQYELAWLKKVGVDR